MMENVSISDDDLRVVFAKCADEITSDDAQIQLGTVGDMLRATSDYLNQNIVGLDVTVITLLLEELNNIKNGNEAKFIKSAVAGGGRPLHAGKNARQAALCAAIQILCNSGIKKKQAVEQVAEWSGVGAKQLDNLRADFMKGNKSRDATALVERWVKQQKEQNLDPDQHARSLIEAALKIGE